MSTAVVVGAQWGDEGKGKIVDYLAESAHLVVRYQGGNNAGHTVVVGEKVYKLHLVPSGVFYPEKTCVIGHGVVIDPAVLVKELDYLAGHGITRPNLRISAGAHLIMPYHIRLDKADEERKGCNKIGTTCCGIGPAYMDKFARVGLRVIDLLDREEFLARLECTLATKNAILEKVYGLPGFSVREIAEPYLDYAERIRPYVTDTVTVINEAIEAEQRVLFEGAQGTLLDIDFGTYPYVTSSHPIAGGACIGAGIGPNKIGSVIGVVKAYTSRVGDGPFPTELCDQTGDFIREKGQEYGTTTGRPRRVGWLDTVMVRFAKRVSGLTGLAVTRLDTLGAVSRIKMCTGYRIDGQITRDFPIGLKALAKAEPVYEEFEGWGEEIPAVARIEELPKSLREYLTRLADVSGVPVQIFSTGRERVKTVVINPVFQ